MSTDKTQSHDTTKQEQKYSTDFLDTQLPPITKMPCSNHLQTKINEIIMNENGPLSLTSNQNETKLSQTSPESIIEKYNISEHGYSGFGNELTIPNEDRIDEIMMRIDVEPNPI